MNSADGVVMTISPGLSTAYQGSGGGLGGNSRGGVGAGAGAGVGKKGCIYNQV